MKKSVGVVVVSIALAIAVHAQAPSKPVMKSGGPSVQAQRLAAEVDPVASLQAQVRQLRAQVQELKR